MPKRRTKNCEPVIALGAMTFGYRTTAREAERMMAAFLDAGHTWMDTANMYTHGRSESIIGRFLKGRRRDRVFLATKVYPGHYTNSSRFGLRPERIREKLHTSLKRLRTNCVDLLYLHAPDNATPLEITLGACHDLVREGKTREIGLSNYPAWQVAEAVTLCLRNNWQPPIIYQGMYNAITRQVEGECLPACRHFGVDFIAYNPLAGGLLTGKHLGAAAAPKTGRFSSAYYRERYWKKEYSAAVEAIAVAARRSRVSLTDAALRWLLHHSMADGLVIGAGTTEQLARNLAACREPPLSPALCKAFDTAWRIARPVCDRYFRN